MEKITKEVLPQVKYGTNSSKNENIFMKVLKQFLLGT